MIKAYIQYYKTQISVMEKYSRYKVYEIHVFDIHPKPVKITQYLFVFIALGRWYECDPKHTLIIIYQYQGFIDCVIIYQYQGFIDCVFFPIKLKKIHVLINSYCAQKCD